MYSILEKNIFYLVKPPIILNNSVESNYYNLNLITIEQYSNDLVRGTANRATILNPVFKQDLNVE